MIIEINVFDRMHDESQIIEVIYVEVFKEGFGPF